MKKVSINLWPESQPCIGCKQGSLIMDVSKYGHSAYICDLGICPDGKTEEGCSKCELKPEEE